MEHGKSEEKEVGALEKDKNNNNINNVTNVEFHVSISEPKEQNLDLKAETENKGIEQNPVCWRDEEDVEVNIIGNSGLKSVEDNYVDLDETESSSSSSFGDTGSGLDTGSDSAFSDSDEVQSPVSEEWNELRRLRKKKVTAHWRKFICPIMWRCKWIELQLRKLNYQAQKYEKELAAYDHKKQLDLLKYAVDGFAVKSVPKSEGTQKNKVMKRKKRKRVEECDPSSYMSKHCLFSYYENKDHNHDAPVNDIGDDVASSDDNAGEFKLSDMWSSVDQHEDNDNSMIEIIEKAEELLLQVENLKARIDNVIKENPGIARFIETTNRTHLEVPGENTKAKVTQNQAAKEELLVEKSKGSVEEQKSISAAQVSDSDMATENVVRDVHSRKPCSTSKSHFTRRVRKKSGP